MPITREDVRRNIFPTDMGRSHKSSAKTAPAQDQAAMPTHKSSSKIAPAADQVPMPTNVASNLRTRNNKHANQNDVVRLDRLTTAEFDKIIGEGSDPSSQVEKKKLGEQKKVQANLKLDNICAINSQIVLENSVRNNMNQEQDRESGSPTLHDDDKLEETLPLDHPSPKQDGNAIGSEVREHPTDDRNVVPPPVNNQLIVEECMGREVQTEPVIVMCSCPRCEAFFDALNLLLKTAETSECQFLKTSEETSKTLSTSFGSLFTATSDNSKRDTPLYMGSTILLTSTDKSMLKDLDPQDDDPKDFVTMIMEGIYTVEQMANMSAMGRTPGSIPMDPTIFKQIFAYLRHKYKDVKNVDITKSAVVSLVNAKCYAMRRQCWEKIRKTEVQSDGKSRNLVRKPLPKKGKDPNKPCSSSKRKRIPTDKSLPPQKKHRNDRSDRESKTARCDESAKKNIKEVKKHRKYSQDSSEIRHRKSEKIKSTKEMRSEKLDIREVKEKDKAIKEQRSEKNSRTKVSSEGHKRGKSVGRMFQSDSSKHHWLSPKKANTRGQRMSPSPKKANTRGQRMSPSPKKANTRGQRMSPSPKKANTRGQRMSPSPKKGDTRVYGSDSSPGIFNSRPAVKPTVDENKMLTSTPKYGGKRPKSMEELLKLTYNKNPDGHGHQSDNEGEVEAEEYDDSDSEDESEDDDDDMEQDGRTSDTGVQYIYSSNDDSDDELQTD